jgi:hypothetical protein
MADKDCFKLKINKIYVNKRTGQRTIVLPAKKFNKRNNSRDPISAEVTLKW